MTGEARTPQEGHQHLGEAWGPCRECGQPVYHEVHTKWAFPESVAQEGSALVEVEAIREALEWGAREWHAGKRKQALAALDSLLARLNISAPAIESDLESGDLIGSGSCTSEASGEGNDPGTGAESLDDEVRPGDICLRQDHRGLKARVEAAERENERLRETLEHYIALAARTEADVMATTEIPAEDVERAGELARERGWKDIGPLGVTSDPAAARTEESA